MRMIRGGMLEIKGRERALELAIDTRRSSAEPTTAEILERADQFAAFLIEDKQPTSAPKKAATRAAKKKK